MQARTYKDQGRYGGVAQGAGSCDWPDQQLTLDLTQDPKPELRHEERKSFVLLNSFCYLVPPNDPDAGTIYVVPGADAPPANQKSESQLDGHRVVVPPHDGSGTDLASVPWFLWWLVASYGNHTRAALLHDALIVSESLPEPVPRTRADRLLLTALREPGQKTGVFRHWLMWAAVSVFGTMRSPLWIRPFLFGVQLVAVWALVATGVVWTGAWGLSIVGFWDAFWLSLAIVGALLLLGALWRFGVGIRFGWMVPITLITAAIALAVWVEWSGDFETTQPRAFWVLLIAAVLVVAGLVWGFGVDKTLRGWLWPTAVVGMPIALAPVGLVFISTRVVWLLDIGAAVAAIGRKEDGRRRGFVMPRPEPFRWPG
jgi:hypothetical protein